MDKKTHKAQTSHGPSAWIAFMWGPSVALALLLPATLSLGDDRPMDASTGESSIMLDPGFAGSSYQAYVARILAGSDLREIEQLAIMAGMAEDWQVASDAAVRARELAGVSELIAVEITAWVHLDALDRAFEALVLGLQAPDSEWTGWNQLGELLRFVSANDKALMLLDRLEATFPEQTQTPIFLEQRARVLVGLNEIDQALALVERALALELTAKRVIKAMDLASRLGEPERVMPWVNQVPAKDQTRPEFALAHYHLLLHMNQPEQGLVVLQAATPTPQVLFYLIKGAQALDRPAAIAEAWERMPTSADATSAKDAYYVAHSAQLLGRLGQAWTWFERVTQPPWSHEAVMARGHLLLEFSRSQGWDALSGGLASVRAGLSDLRQAATVTDKVNQAWALEIQLLRGAGQHEAIIEMLSEALVEAPEDEFLLYLRGISAMGHHRLELAEQDFRRLIQLNGSHADALNALGYMLADNNMRLREAYQLIYRAHQLNPQSAEILDSMGWVNYRLGRLEQAHQYLQQAYAQHPDPEILAHLVEVLTARGKTAEVEALLADQSTQGLGSSL